MSRVANNPIENVEWFVKDNKLHAYIIAETRTYYFSCELTKIPDVVAMMLNKNGEVRGVKSRIF